MREAVRITNYSETLPGGFGFPSMMAVVAKTNNGEKRSEEWTGGSF
jgi:hypothetical protein